MSAWIKSVLEHSTSETWIVADDPRSSKKSLYVKCVPHGMWVLVPYVNPSLNQPFLTQDDERKFVGKVLRQHAESYLK